MVGDSGLSQADGFREVADAGLPVLLRGDDGHEAQPSWLRHGLEELGEPLGVFGAEYFLGHGRTAGVGNGLGSFLGSVHRTIMPEIDILRYKAG